MTNPFLSAWLSAANAWTGAARGYWMAALHQQQNAMMREAMRFWMSPWLAQSRPAPSAKRKAGAKR